MASITELWIDNFDDGVVGLDVDAGNGSVSEAGSELSVAGAPGVSCNGWDGVTAPYATKDLAPLVPDPSTGLVIIEARITGFDGSDNNRISYLVLDFDRTHGFWFGWYPTNSNLYVQGRQGSGGVNFFNGGTYTGPSVAPHRYRIVANFTHQPRRIPDVISQYSLSPGEVAFVASVDDGASWGWVHTRELSIINPGGPTPSDYRFGFMARNFTTNPSFEQKADYLRVLQTTGDLERTIPKEPQEQLDELVFTDAVRPVATPGGTPAPRKAGAHTEGAGGTDDYTWTGLLGDEHQGGGAAVPDVAKQGRSVLGSPTHQRDEAGFRDADNAGVDSSESDDAGKALSVGFGVAGPPRYLYPHRAPTEDRRFGGPGAGQPERKGVRYPTDGRIIGSDLGIGSRWYGVSPYPADKSKPHPSEAEVLDDCVVALGHVPDYTTASIDQYGRPHFGSSLVRAVAHFLYDTTGELWTTPTDPSFTGYGRDGKYYVNGIDQGSQAPWAMEAPSDTRGGRADFPERALVVVASDELVIYDLVQYPTHLNLWMRFLVPNSSSLYYMLGRGPGTLRSAVMKDGVLCVAGQQTPWEEGRVHLVNFRATNQNCGHMIGTSNHWYWGASYNISHRNENGRWTSTGPSPSLRIKSAYNRSIAAAQEGDTLHIAVAGESSNDPSVLRVDSPSGVPQLVTNCYGEDAAGTTKCCLFDAAGHLWHSNDTQLWHNGVDYRDGVVFASRAFGRQRVARLPATITQLVDDGRVLWAGTTNGVYRVEKGTLAYRLAYGIAGRNAGGRLAVPGQGDLIPGSIAAVAGLSIVRMVDSSFLAVATGPQVGGGAVLIRLYDDEVLDSKVFPALDENGAYSHGLVFG